FRSYSRSFALECVKKKTDYAWVIDADDYVVGDFKFPDPMIADAYELQINFNGSTCKRKQIFKLSDVKWKYVCVLHEFPVCTNKSFPNVKLITGNYHIEARCMGTRSKNPNKYLKDAKILVEALKTPSEHDARYTFYAGQSFMHYGDYKSAEEYYFKCTKLNGWFEERFYAYNQIARISVILKRDE